MFVAWCKQWQENLACPNSGPTGFSLIPAVSLQCKLELEDWYMIMRKMYWERSKRVSALESLLWAQILHLHHRPPRIHFSRKVTWQGDFCHLKEAANLILSWHSLCSWHWVDTERLCSVCTAPIGTETLCMIVIIVIGNLTLSLQKTQLQAQSFPSTVLLR